MLDCKKKVFPPRRLNCLNNIRNGQPVFYVLLAIFCSVEIYIYRLENRLIWRSMVFFCWPIVEKPKWIHVESIIRAIYGNKCIVFTHLDNMDKIRKRHETLTFCSIRFFVFVYIGGNLIYCMVNRISILQAMQAKTNWKFKKKRTSCGWTSRNK